MHISFRVILLDPWNETNNYCNIGTTTGKQNKTVELVHKSA